MTVLYAIGDFVGFVERPMPAPQREPKFWYMLRLHPNYDLKAERQLADHGVSAYVPKEKRSIRGVWNRRIARDVSIFPGALFIPDFEANLPRLKRICDGIGGFVKFGDVPIEISIKAMDRIRHFEARLQGRTCQKFAIGQRVRITSGPWALFEGKIERLERRYRIRLLIEFLGREVPFELDEDEVEAV